MIDSTGYLPHANLKLLLDVALLNFYLFAQEHFLLNPDLLLQKLLVHCFFLFELTLVNFQTTLQTGYSLVELQGATLLQHNLLFQLLNFTLHFQIFFYFQLVLAHQTVVFLDSLYLELAYSLEVELV